MLKTWRNNLEWGEEEASILSYRPVTSSNLKQDRLFFRESVSTFLQLVLAYFIPGTHSVPHYHRKENRIETNTMPAAESVCVRKSYIKMNIPPNYLNPDTYLYGELNVITAETYMYMSNSRVVAVQMEDFRYEFH